MESSKPGLKACHNCRRQRLKCDRSLPQCLKCMKKGQMCLGYQGLFRWAKGVASRGKMAGMTFEDMTNDPGRNSKLSQQSLSPASPLTQQFSCGNIQVLPLGFLEDPLVQDLDQASRKYLAYFASDVCKDLVLYDVPTHNPFRELIPLAQQHPVLLQIIVANSALHMANACQRPLVLDATDFPLSPPTSLLSFPCSSSSPTNLLEAYKDALAAKQRALYLLKSALTNIASVDIDVTLAVVLLFIEFELIDSGRDNWKYHTTGARKLIETLYKSKISTQTIMTPLRRFLISNCLVYDIFGSTLTYSSDLEPSDTLSSSTLSLLQDAEGNHCASFPVVLLQLIRAGAQLYQPNESSRPLHSSTGSKQRQQQALFLLNSAQAFDPLDWATNVQPDSPTPDLLHRTHVASAHQTAVCIYLSRVLLSLDQNTQLPHDLEHLVADIITYLSFIHPNDSLFKATAWPAFVAGAETNQYARQRWVARRFQELWEVEPWGLIRGALGVLENIWLERSGMVMYDDETLQIRTKRDGDWIGDLKGRGVDWLII